MDSLIAYCGLDCAKCEARIATITNDNKLRAEVAKKWSELNGIEITPEMINCEGCRVDGVKTIFCDKLCEIRQCALHKNYETCGYCDDMNTCSKIKMIIGTNKDALDNLIKNSKEKYRVNPVKVNKKRKANKDLTGEDIDLLNDNKRKSKHISICDSHIDGA